MAGIAKKDARLWKVVATYDFAVHGGAVGTIDLKHGLSKGCVVVGGFMRILTVPTSGGSATIAAQLEAANDIVTATAFDNALFATTGNRAIVPVWTAATMKETTVDRNLSLVIGGAALTAGKIEFHLWVDQIINILS